MSGSLVSTIKDAWRDDFPGGALRTDADDPSSWRVVQTGPGQTVAVGSSVLQIASGTQVGETILRSRKSFLGPFRVAFLASGALLSQRIANQEIELRVATDDGAHVASILFDGTTATTHKLRCANGGVTAGDVTLTSSQSSAGAALFELEVTPADVFLHAGAPDTTTGRTGTGRKNLRIPDPDTTLHVEIRVRNTGVAASSTTLSLDAVVVEDVEEVTTEVTGGRGGNAPAQAIPVATRGGTVDTVTAVTRAGAVLVPATTAETTTNLAAGATFTGSSKDLGTSPSQTRLRAAATSDQPGRLVIDVSHDGTLWTPAIGVSTHVATESSVLDVPAVGRYWRVRYTNTGAATTTAMRVLAATASG